MATHDYNIANQGFPAFRADLNDALAAIVSNNSNATAPATTFAHMLWVDTAANPSVLKIRNADNDAWITIGSINQTDDKFKLTPADGVSTDTISELTSAAGVTVDGVLLKDSGVVTGAGTVSAPVYSTTGDTNTGIFFPAADQVAITTGGTQRALVDASGNVGVRSSGGTTPTYDFSTLGEGLFFRYWDSSGTRFADLVAIGNTPAGATQNMRFFTNTGSAPGTAVERMRLTSDGYLRMASGSGGIQFGGDTAAANALDDYEEGTWTPAFDAASGSATYTNQQGTYTKIGRQVTAVFYITVNTSSSLVATGISGLPFTGSSTNYAGTSFSVWSGIGGYCNVIGLTGAATTIQIRSTNSATSPPVLNSLTVSNGAEIAGTVTYFT